MRFLLDQDVYAATARFLQLLGHDVTTVAQLGLSRAADSDLLRVARDQGWILITRDRDFGNLVFVEDLRTGVLYLRVLPSTLEAVHREVSKLLSAHPEDELRRAFVVVEPGRHRVRRLGR